MSTAENFEETIKKKRPKLANRIKTVSNNDKASSYIS